MDRALQVKNLITVGVFTAIYIVLFFASGTLGFIPIGMVLLPFILPVVTGIPFVLFVTKIKGFGMVSLMGLLLGLFMLITGHLWPTFTAAIIFGVVSDLILRAGRYKQWGSIVLGYIAFSAWIIGFVIPFFYMRSLYFAKMEEGYGEEYTTLLLKLLPDWMFYTMSAMIVAGALLGAWLGRRVLRKHFLNANV